MASEAIARNPPVAAPSVATPAAEVVPEAVAAYRRKYRDEQIGPRYSGVAHLLTTSIAALGGVLACALAVRSARPVEWLTVPLAFLFANLVEYGAHRGPMHHRLPIDLFITSLLYQRHALAHHRYYTDESMAAESHRDYKMVLFPPQVVFFFIGLVALPTFFVLRAAVTPNVGYLFSATALGYFVSYEWLHLAYHLPRGSRIGRLAVIAALRRHHAAHHDPRKMQRWNFNITFPIADALFGTTFRPASGGTSDPDRSADLAAPRV